PAMPEPHTLILRIPLADAIRSARGHMITNAPQLHAINRVGGVMIGVDARDATHDRPIRCCLSAATWLRSRDVANPPAPPASPPRTAGSPIARCARDWLGPAAAADPRLRSAAEVRVQAPRRPQLPAYSR